MSKLFLPILTILLFSACKTDESNTTSSEANTTENAVIPEAISEELDGLTLNGDQKWIVDQSTQKGMEKVSELVAEFDGTDSEKLGKKIKKELNKVIKDCDFKGEDHEQFHIVLHAMLKEAKRLKKGKSTDPGKMQQYLDAYNSHFEVGELE